MWPQQLRSEDFSFLTALQQPLEVVEWDCLTAEQPQLAHAKVVVLNKLKLRATIIADIFDNIELIINPFFIKSTPNIVHFLRKASFFKSLKMLIFLKLSGKGIPRLPWVLRQAQDARL